MRKLADLEIGRHLRNITLGAAWAFITHLLLPRVPIEALGPEPAKVWMSPLRLAVMISNQDGRARVKEFLGLYTSEQRINSRWAKLYIEGRFADCNCSACRRNKASVRNLLIKHYLIAYCVRCRRKVSIKNPHQVIFANGREAIGGTCPTCDTKVFKTGKFYGANLFET